MLWSGRDQRAGLLGQVGVEVRAPAARQQPGEDRQHEDHADHRGDRAGGVPDQRADGQREHAEHGEVEAGTDDGAGHAGVAERHRRRGRAGWPSRPRTSRRPRSRSRTSSSTANTIALAASTGIRRGTASSEARITPVEYSLVMTSTPRTQMASWPSPIPVPRMKPTGSADGPDVPGRGPRADPVRFGQPGDQRREADGHHDEDDQRPERGAHRADLRPLGPQQAAEPGVAAGVRDGGAAGRGDRRAWPSSGAPVERAGLIVARRTRRCRTSVP